MATLTLSPEARAKRLAKKVETPPTKPIEQKEHVIHPVEAEQRARAAINRQRAKEWLDANYPKLLSDPSKPFEIGISKKIRCAKPKDIPSQSIDFWINTHVRLPEYLSAREMAEKGSVRRFSLEEFKA